LPLSAEARRSPHSPKNPYEIGLSGLRKLSTDDYLIRRSPLGPVVGPGDRSGCRRWFRLMRDNRCCTGAAARGIDGRRVTAAPPRHRVSRGGRARQKIRRQGQAFDHENRKTPISKPAANAQRPNVQAETTRTRLRRSCGISSDRSVIAAAPLRSNCWGRPLCTGQCPAMDSS
jgi:hypothetical protein